MPDYSFIAQPKTSEGLQTLGSIVNTAGALQNMQRGAVALEQERALLQPNIAKGRAESALAQTHAASAQWGFDRDQAQKAYEVAAGISQDPAVVNGDSAGIVKALLGAENQMRAMKIPEEKIRTQLAPLFLTATTQPQAVRQILDNIVRGGAGVQAQANVINAPVTMTESGTSKIPVQLQPGARGGQQPGGPGVPIGIPPSGAERLTQDALGRPTIEATNQSGAKDYKAPPGSDYKPMMTLPAGETPQTAAPLLALRDASQAAAAAVPAQRYNNKKILELSDSAFTGTGSEQLAKVLNAVGLQRTNDTGADTAKLQHFIGLQIQQNAASMGANTDAARQLAAQAVLPGSSPAKAIKDITKINDAYAEGTALFNRGMDATLKNPSNTKDIFAIRDFQNAWTRNFDPRIIMLQNAQSAGDKAEVERIRKSLRPEEMKELLGKARALQGLITNGAVGGP